MKNTTIAMLLMLVVLGQAQTNGASSEMGGNVNHGNGYPSGNSGYRPSGYNGGYSHDEEELIEDVSAVFMAIAVAASLVGLALGFFMICKCMKLRGAREQIKQQMQMKRQEYATMMGLNTFEISQHSHTVHV
jgi:hypothetical protein